MKTPEKAKTAAAVVIAALGAALIIAALMARGTSEIYEPGYIDRGYEHIEEKLRSLGAEIRRESAE